MQDLLREEEFIKAPYSPWKLFLKFYIVAIIQVLILQAVVSFWIIGTGGLLLAIVYFLLPLCMVVVMFTVNVKNFFIDRQLKIKGILGLVLCYAVTNLLVNTIKVVFIRNSFVTEDIIFLFGSVFGYFVAEFLISVFLIYVVSLLVKRRLKKV